jgi:hypothetical protein
MEDDYENFEFDSDAPESFGLEEGDIGYAIQASIILHGWIVEGLTEYFIKVPDKKTEEDLCLLFGDILTAKLPQNFRNFFDAQLCRISSYPAKVILVTFICTKTVDENDAIFWQTQATFRHVLSDFDIFLTLFSECITACENRLNQK